MLENESAALLMRLQAGDRTAADEIFLRYVQRLVAFAEQKLSDKLARKVDAEDIVQSVFRSFFVRAESGTFQVDGCTDLWSLLAAITVHKVLKQAERHAAAKRSLAAEQSFGDVNCSYGILPEPLCKEPTAAEAVILAEEFELLLAELNPIHRQILELKFQGSSVEQISLQTGRAERQVRRVLQKAQQTLEGRLVALTN